MEGSVLVVWELSYEAYMTVKSHIGLHDFEVILQYRRTSGSAAFLPVSLCTLISFV